MKIVITDSGLGGLSVLGELESRLNKLPIYQNAELIFFNSLYSSNYGYNSMSSMEEKALVFNNALNSMLDNYNPDIILIACNTLSVVYPHTDFSKSTKIPVYGILESGVNLFWNQLEQQSDKIILFGTPTTISSNSYKKLLIEKGVGENQIINQSCPELETKIQNNPNSQESKQEIAKFINSAIGQLAKSPQRLFAGLCCTHYWFSEDIFYEELSKANNGEVKILNPNTVMLDFLFQKMNKLYSATNISVKVVSQVKLKNNEINSFGNVLSINSLLTSDALSSYDFVEELFGKT